MVVTLNMTTAHRSGREPHDAQQRNNSLKAKIWPWSQIRGSKPGGIDWQIDRQ
jgi:hypothetical protein